MRYDPPTHPRLADRDGLGNRELQGARAFVGEGRGLQMPRRKSPLLTLFCVVVGISLSADAEYHGSSQDDLDAATIMDLVAHTYLSSNTYRDTGTVVTETSILGIPIALLGDTIHFSTAFIRPDRFRFEYQYRFRKSGDWDTHIVHADPSGVRTYWDVDPGITQESSLGLALAGATGVSHGAAHTIPALLLPEVVVGRRVTEMENLSRLRNDVIDGHEFLRIRGEYRTGTPLTIWIDPETYLIRRIRVGFTLYLLMYANFTTDYASDVDEHIDPDALRFAFPG